MAVFLAEGQAGAEQLQAGDVGYAPMGAGHYVHNVGPPFLKVLISFNNGPYLANDRSAWMSTNPPDADAASGELHSSGTHRIFQRESHAPRFLDMPQIGDEPWLIAARVVALSRLGEAKRRVAPESG